MAGCSGPLLLLMAALVANTDGAHHSKMQMLRSPAGGDVVSPEAAPVDVKKSIKTGASAQWHDAIAKQLEVPGDDGNALEVLHNGKLVQESSDIKAVEVGQNFQINVIGEKKAFGDTECPVSSELAAPYPAKLSVCSEFAASSCCTVREEEKIAYLLQTEYSVVYGECPGCLDNMRKLLCGIHCSPEQKKVMTLFQDNTIVQVNICSSFCDALYSSCRDTKFASSFHGDDASSFCLPQLDSLADIRIDLVTPDEDRLCLDPEGAWQCIPQEEKVADEEASSSDTWFLWLLLLLLLILLLLCTGGYMYKQSNVSAMNSNKAKAKAYGAHSMGGGGVGKDALAAVVGKDALAAMSPVDRAAALAAMPDGGGGGMASYFFVDGSNHTAITGGVLCNGYYIKRGGGRWKWIAPATPRPQQKTVDCDALIEAYEAIASDRGDSYEAVELSTLKSSGDHSKIKGPATVICRLQSVTTLGAAQGYLDGQNAMELYADIFVGEPGTPYPNKETVVVFEQLNHALSKPSNNLACEWDDIDAVGVKFEVANVDQAHLRPVIRDKGCMDKSKIGCRLKRVVVGTCPRLNLLQDDGDFNKSARDTGMGAMKRENLPPGDDGAFVVQYSGLPLAPYFMYAANDVLPHSRDTMGFKVRMLLKIMQEGWLIRRTSKADSEELFTLPQTKHFQRSKWMPCQDDTQAPSGATLQQLKPVCSIIHDTIHLSLGVFVEPSGDNTWRMISRNDYVASEAGNECAALIQDFSKKGHKKLLDPKKFSCSSKITDTEGHEAEVVFFYEVKDNKPVKKTLYVKLEMKEFEVGDQRTGESKKRREQVMGLYVSKDDEAEVPLLQLDFDKLSQRATPTVRVAYSEEDLQDITGVSSVTL